MPNHVTNKIKFYGKQEQINRVLERISGRYEYISFNKIIPMPEYEADNWYDWSIANWGTKWDAYHSYHYEDSNTLFFDTAWNTPMPVFDTLSKLCDNYGVWFEGCWADEDRGRNIGRFASDDGEFSFEYLENYSNEALDIYVELKGEDNCMGKDENGNWVVYNCDTCPNKDNC